MDNWEDKLGQSNKLFDDARVIAEKGDKKTQHALELNKSVNHEDGTDTMVLLFAKKGAVGGSGMGQKMPPDMGGMKKK